MKTVFGKGLWNPADFRYIYSPKFAPTPEFTQEETCLVNRGDPAAGRYDYVSMITVRKFRAGTEFSTLCSFEKYGAPLIVITDDVRRGGHGELRYGRHMEIVAYEGGVNVWRLEPLTNDVKPTNLLRQKFEVPAGKPLRLTVRPMSGKVEISCFGNTFSVETDCVPGEFFAGVTACEGINRFYDFTAEESPRI